METLYSNIQPLGTSGSQQTFADLFNTQFQASDTLKIAVGYASIASLEELDRLVYKHKLKNVVLVMGMYFVHGIPRNLWRTAVQINYRWQKDGIGEIRLVRSLAYHGKLYLFEKDDHVHTAVLGSANLSVIKPEASTIRQYELSMAVQEPQQILELQNHFDKLADKRNSENISKLLDLKIIPVENEALNENVLVNKISNGDTKIYASRKTDISFELPLKVPSFGERFLDDSKHYTKSNINVCYAAPRSKSKNRDWYETQITVGKKITTMPGYPEKGVPFMVVTDDGYTFKAHTTSASNKQFSAVGDELILGKWIKGRLAAAGIVKPVNDTGKDFDRLGMITKEMLDEYGHHSLRLTKTDRQILDESGNRLDVWHLAFE